MRFETDCLFEWRGPKHRTVVEMPKGKRNTEHMEAINTAWLKKNRARTSKTRSTDDQPRWYIWENELMDSEKYEEQQKELKRKEADPENQAGQTGKGRKSKSKGDESSASAFAEDEMD